MKSIQQGQQPNKDKSFCFGFNGKPNNNTKDFFSKGIKSRHSSESRINIGTQLHSGLGKESNEALFSNKSKTHKALESFKRLEII